MAELTNYIAHDIAPDAPTIAYSFKVENVDVLDIKSFISARIRSIIESIPEDKYVDLTIQVDENLIRQIDKPNVLWNAVFSVSGRIHRAIVESF